MRLESFPLPETLRPGAARAPGEDRRQRQELRHAAQTGGFLLAFQPRRDLVRDVTTGAALQLHWPRRGGGMTPATGFMPMLESLGLAGDVAGWALNGACAAASAWPRGQICVAVDPGALREGKLLRQVAHALAASGLAPERLELPGGRKAKVIYTPGSAPMTAARIQDLYGVTILTVAKCRQPVTIQILAPNQRPVQITTDLANFWKESYPKIKQELSRKYPKHEWR